MRCDVVAIGTELLLGQIVDTNSAWLGEQLSAAGIDSCLQVKVGDNLERMVKAIRTTLADADAVIICGGLGPTHDDITREAIAEIMGVALEFDDAVGMAISEMFAARNRRMPEINMRQAMVPKGAAIIEQRRGTAPGLICPVGDKVIYAVPGVPYELYEMFERAILPDLLTRSGSASVISSRVLRTWGESESGLNETVRAAIGDIVFGIDTDTMESVVLQMLRERGLTLGLAESVTGGLVAGRLTGIEGASEVFRGGVVSYATEVKHSVLGVQSDMVVNEEAAIEMAVGACKVLGASVGLALTGVAGPASQEGVKPGTLCVGVCLPDGTTASTTFALPAVRDQMRQLSVISALDFLRRHIREL